MVEPGDVIAEGKTKIIFGTDDPNMVRVHSKDEITAFDNPSKTRRFKGKGKYCNATTGVVFSLLKIAGVPVAWERGLSETDFLAKKCTMLPLEAVSRRYAVGSYLKRNPHGTPAKGQNPHRFHRLVTELFLKTTKGQLVDPNGEVVLSGLSPETGEEDPLILDPRSEEWVLVHSKKPIWDSSADLKKSVSATDIFRRFTPEVTHLNAIEEIEKINRMVFLILEGAWSNLGLRLIDLKIELGVHEGKILVADVIDNDSWRLKDQNWNELSKELFRWGQDLGEVEEKYALVASWIQQFRIPRQTLVLWRGSDKDEFPKTPETLSLAPIGVDVLNITASGHKSPQRSLRELEAVLAGYPEKGVIVVKVGKSNGLGPMLAARTSWPVITIPATIKTFSDDVWSSLSLPSAVPMATVVSEENALSLAFEILAQKNPTVYANLQYAIEELDD